MSVSAASTSEDITSLPIANTTSAPSITTTSTNPAPTSASTISGPTSNRSSTLSTRGRPPLPTRPSSGTIIVTRDAPSLTPSDRDEVYDEHDARAMSPRRSSSELEAMGAATRDALEEQAKSLQASLLEIVERVDVVKSEHEKLEGRNRFLQSYIGELMQTSKITSTGAAEGKKGRKRKGK